jgi:hypothetical protein
LGRSETLRTLTSDEVTGILEENRRDIFQGFYQWVLGKQIMPDTMEDDTHRVPKEVVGLDFWHALGNWQSKGHGDDDWRNDTARQMGGIGYTGFPEEVISAFTAVYLLAPFLDAGGNPVEGLDHYHDSTLLQRIVSAFDGCTYQQGSNGGFPHQGDAWIGLTSTPRGAGNQWPGTTTRQETRWGGGALQGANDQALGWAIIQLLNDPAMPTSGGADAPANFIDYLKQSYDADLDGGSMMRAYAYERMLWNHMKYTDWAMGTVVSQQLFNVADGYSTYVALEKLQALFPNDAYTKTFDGYDRAQQGMGQIPSKMWKMSTGTSLPANYELTPSGLGEGNGSLSCGFDGGGYGQYIPWLAPHIAQMAKWDPKASPEMVAAFAKMANATINAFDQFLSPADNVTIEHGDVTSDTFNFCEERFITYRHQENPNAACGRTNFNIQYAASDPDGGINNAYARRAAYLGVIYGFKPEVQANDGDDGKGGNLGFLRDLKAYESTLRSLIDVDPSKLTPLPGEPGQPDYAWADTRAGSVAFINHGERFYMNANYRSLWSSGGWDTITPSNFAMIHDTTPTIERAAQIYLPHDETTVQDDGNLSGNNMSSPYVVRYGDYLIIMNNGTDDASAALPSGPGTAKDLISGKTYNLGTTVTVPANQSAIFWLKASGTDTPAM